MPDDDGSEDEQPTMSPLEPKTRDMVVTLFKDWDFKGDGKIPLTQLQGGTIEVGPNEQKAMGYLAGMDSNGDGFVEEGEWIYYFTAIYNTLDHSEFAAIYDELKEKGDDMVTIMRCTAIAAQQAPVGDEDLSEMPDALPEGRAGDVQKLWEAWESDGKISIEEMGSTEIGVGNLPITVLKDLKAMDFDDDKFVTRDEMEMYFAVASPTLPDKQWEAIMSVMLEGAEIVRTLKLAEEVKNNCGVGENGDEDDAAEEPPPLDEQRLARIKKLFAAFDLEGTGAPIKLSAMGDTKTTMGPHVTNLLLGLKKMDVDNDGYVTYDEMVQYFQAAGQMLDDSEYGILMDEMIDSATAQQYAKTYAPPS